jgi:hypothetical protein
MAGFEVILEGRAGRLAQPRGETLIGYDVAHPLPKQTQPSPTRPNQNSLKL